MNPIEENLKKLGLELPPAPPPMGVYKPAIVIDGMLYVSGQGPVRTDGSLITGKVGADLNLEEGYEAAKQVGLTMLATIKSHLGGFEEIHRIVKTLGMVNSTMEFSDHPKVINGFSDLMNSLLGSELGIGARSAVGMMLPSQVAVEIEAIWQLK